MAKLAFKYGKLHLLDIAAANNQLHSRVRVYITAIKQTNQINHSIVGNQQILSIVNNGNKSIFQAQKTSPFCVWYPTCAHCTIIKVK